MGRVRSKGFNIWWNLERNITWQIKRIEVPKLSLYAHISCSHSMLSTALSSGGLSQTVWHLNIRTFIIGIWAWFKYALQALWTRLSSIWLYCGSRNIGNWWLGSLDAHMDLIISSVKIFDSKNLNEAYLCTCICLTIFKSTVKYMLQIIYHTYPALWCHRHAINWR